MADRYWVNPNPTGASWNSTASWSATSGGTAGASVPTAADNVFFDGASRDLVGQVNFEVNMPAAATMVCKNFYCTHGSFTYFRGVAGANLTVSGDWYNGNTADFGTYAYQGTITFAGTGTGLTAHKIENSNGTETAFNGPVVINTTGEYVLTASLNFTYPLDGGTGTRTVGTFTLTAGTLRLNGYTIATHRFTATGTGVRTLDFGCPGSAFTQYSINSSGKGLIYLYDPDQHGATNTTPLNCPVLTSLTLSNTEPDNTQTVWSVFDQIIAFLGNGSSVNAFVRTYTWGTTSTVTQDVNLTFYGTNAANGANVTASITTGSRFRTLSFTGYSSTVANTAYTVQGGFYINANGFHTPGANAITFAANIANPNDANGLWYYSSATRLHDVPLTFAATSATRGHYTSEGIFNNLRPVTLVSGILKLSPSYTNFIGTFSSNNSNARTLDGENCSIRLQSTGVVWETSTVTNFNFIETNAACLISMINSSNTSRTFNGGPRAYRYVETSEDGITPAVNGGITVLGGGTTFHTFWNGRKSTSHTLRLTASTTTTFNYLGGLSGNDATTRMTINSTTAATAATLAKGGMRRVNQDFDFVTFTDISVTPAGVWYVGSNCTTSGVTSGVLIGPADRYWVAGGDNAWSATAGTKWATTSGGTGGASIPTAGSIVYFDGNSGATACNLSAPGSVYAVLCNTISSISFTGTGALTANYIYGYGGELWKLYTGTWTIAQTNMNEYVGSAAAAPSASNDSYIWLGIGGGNISSAFGGNITIANVNSPSTQILSPLLMKGNLTLTSGGLYINAETYAKTFVSSNTNLRSIEGGSNLHIGLTQPEADFTTCVGGVIWNVADATNWGFLSTINQSQLSTGVKFYTNGVASTINHGSTTFPLAGTGKLSALRDIAIQPIATTGSVAINGHFQNVSATNSGSAVTLTTSGTKTIYYGYGQTGPVTNTSATTFSNGIQTAIAAGLVLSPFFGHNAPSTSVISWYQDGAGTDNGTYIVNMPTTVALDITAVLSTNSIITNGLVTVTVGNLDLYNYSAYLNGGVVHTAGNINAGSGTYLKTYSSSGTLPRALWSINGSEIIVGMIPSTGAGVGGTIWDVANATNWGLYATGDIRQAPIGFVTTGIATTVVNHGTTTLPSKINILAALNVYSNTSTTSASIALNGHFYNLTLVQQNNAAVGALTVTGTRNLYGSLSIYGDDGLLYPLNISGTTNILSGVGSAINTALLTNHPFSLSTIFAFGSNLNLVNDSSNYVIDTSAAAIAEDVVTFLPASGFVTTGSFTLTKGIVDLAFVPSTLTAASFSSAGTLTRQLIMSSGPLSVGGVFLTSATAPWSLTSLTNFSIAYYTDVFGKPLGTISLINNTILSSRTFAGGGYAGYGTISIDKTAGFIEAGSQTVTITGTNTFYTIATTKENAFTLTLPTAVTTTFTKWELKGTAGNIITVNSSSTTVAATVALPAGTKTKRGTNYLNFTWINGSAANQWYIGLNSTKPNSNANINNTLSTVYKKYWVGGSGTWNNSDTTRWSDSSGGAGGATAPTIEDEVIFNALSDVGNTGIPFQVVIPASITLNVYNVDASLLDNPMQLNFTDSTSVLNVFGKFDMTGNAVIGTLNSSSDLCGLVNLYYGETSGLGLKSGQTHAVNIALKLFDSINTYSCSLLSSVSTSGKFTIWAGTLNASGYSLEVGSFYSETDIATPGGKSLNLGTSPIKLIGKDGRTVFALNSYLYSPLATSPMSIYYSGSGNPFRAEYTGTSTSRTIQFQNGDFEIAASRVDVYGSDAVTIPGSFIKDLNFANFTGTATLTGDVFFPYSAGTPRLVLSSTMTLGGSATIVATNNASSGNYTFDLVTNGCSLGNNALGLAGANVTLDNYPLVLRDLLIGYGSYSTTSGGGYGGGPGTTNYYAYPSTLTLTNKIVASGTVGLYGGGLVMNLGSISGSAIRCGAFTSNNLGFYDNRAHHSKFVMTGSISNGYAIECTGGAGTLNLGGRVSITWSNTQPWTENIVDVGGLAITGSGAYLAGTQIQITNISSTTYSPIPQVQSGYDQFNWIALAASRTLNIDTVNSSFNLGNRNIDVGALTLTLTDGQSFTANNVTVNGTSNTHNISSGPFTVNTLTIGSGRISMSASGIVTLTSLVLSNSAVGVAVGSISLSGSSNSQIGSIAMSNLAALQVNTNTNAGLVVTGNITGATASNGFTVSGTGIITASTITSLSAVNLSGSILTLNGVIQGSSINITNTATSTVRTIGSVGTALSASNGVVFTGSALLNVYGDIVSVGPVLHQGSANLNVVGNLSSTTTLTINSGILTTSGNITATTNITYGSVNGDIIANGATSTITTGYITQTATQTGSAKLISTLDLILTSTAINSTFVCGTDGVFQIGRNVTLPSTRLITFTLGDGTATVGGNFSSGSLTLSTGSLTISGNATISGLTLSASAGTLSIANIIGLFGFSQSGGVFTFNNDITISSTTSLLGGTTSIATNADVQSTGTLTFGGGTMNIDSGGTLTARDALTSTGPWIKTGAGANMIYWSGAAANNNMTYTGPAIGYTNANLGMFPKILVTRTGAAVDVELTNNDVIGDFEINDAFTGQLKIPGNFTFGGDLKFGFNTVMNNGGSNIGLINWYALVGRDQLITSNGRTLDNNVTLTISSYSAATSALEYYTKLVDAFTLVQQNSTVVFGSSNFDFNGNTLTAGNVTFNTPATSFYRKVKGIGNLVLTNSTANAAVNIVASTTSIFDKLDLQNVNVDVLAGTSSTTITNNGFESVVPGESVHTTPGSTSFTVPDGVTSISTVSVGAGGAGTGTSTTGSISGGGGAGGALVFGDISVTPGETLTVVTGAGGAAVAGFSNAAAGGDSGIQRSGTWLVRAGGGEGGSTSGNRSNGGTPLVVPAAGIGNSGGQGGNAGFSGSISTTYGAGGGGAAGYTGNGGNGAGYTSGGSTSGSGGGGGGSGPDSSGGGSVQGGGVGIYGLGASGAGTGALNTNGGGGSIDATFPAVYGGGGCGADFTSGSNLAGRSGMAGAVRIVWSSPIVTRSYPSTNVAGISGGTADIIPTKMSLTLRGAATGTTVTLARSSNGNIRFNTLANYMTKRVKLSLPTKTIEVDNWLFNGSVAKQRVQTGNNVYVLGQGSANTTLLKTGSGSGIFKYVALSSLTLSGEWSGTQATAASHSTVVYSSPSKIGWFLPLTTGTSVTIPSTWNNSNNMIHLFGGGGGGGGSLYTNISVARGGSGGQGGGYSQILNYQVAAPGTTSVTYSIGGAGTAGASSGGVGGNGGTTTWDVAFTAQGGQGGSGTIGGNALGVGTGYNGGIGYNGGRGGNARAPDAYFAANRGAGGGGAAGPFGNGVAGQDPSTNGISTTSYGGSNGGGSAAADGTPQPNFFGYTGSHGASGTTGVDILGIDSSGGGGGAQGASSPTSPQGSLYGGGGGGGYRGANSTVTYSGGIGAQGAIMLTWNVPIDIINTQFFLTL